MHCALRPVAPGDIEDLAGRLRRADLDEIAAMSALSPVDALAMSVDKAGVAMVGVMDGVPELIFGAGDASILTGVGAPWLVSSDKLLSRPMWALRESVRWRDKLLSRYAVLRNAVHADNLVSVRWLKWLGFTIHPARPIGRNGELFHVFDMRRSDVP